MSMQCTNCGTQTREGAKFCHGCGTPIGTTSLPPTLPIGEVKIPSHPLPTSTPTSTELPPPAPKTTSSEAPNPTPNFAPAPPRPTSGYAPQVPQTYHHNAMAEAPKKNRGALKAVLITLAIIIFIGTVSVIGAVYFVGKKLQDLANNPTVSFPNVEISGGDKAAEKLGVPKYPNAKSTKFAISANAKNEKGEGGGGMAIFTTDDDIEEVVDFYKEHFGEKAQVKDVKHDDVRTVEISVKDGDGEKKVIVADDKNDDNKTIITIFGGSSKSLPALDDAKLKKEIEKNAEELKKQAKQAAKQAQESAKDAQKQVEQLQKEMQDSLEKNLPPPPPPPAKAPKSN